MRKKLAIGVLAIGCSTCLFAAAPAATAPAAKDAAADKVIAKGKGVEIKQSQLDEAMATIISSMRGQQISPAQLEAVKPRMLDRLIGMQLLANEATAADKATAKANTDKRIAEIEKSAGSKEKLEAQLKTHDITFDELRSKLGEEALAEVVLERVTKVSVTDADAKKYYEDNPARFEQPETIHASHILLMTQDESGKPLPEEKKKEKLKEMEDILKKARAGEDFAKLAEKYSEDPGSKDKGGEYTFSKGQMVPEFEKTALSLKTNEISDIITTQFGYHIIKLHEINPARKLPYAEVAEKLKEGLTAQAVQKDMPEVVEKLKKEADVKILDESLKPKPTPMEGLSGMAPPQKAPEPEKKTSK